MPRLFTGIEIPEAVGFRLENLRGGLRPKRWIDSENYHITLRFIGDIDNDLADDVADLLGSVRRKSFTLTLDGLGAFGGKRPHAVWARVCPSPELLALQAELEQVCQRAGLRPDTRKYTPHITLARVRGLSSADVAHYLSLHGDFYCPDIPVTRFALYSAKPSTGGGPYVIERAYPLSDSGDD